MNQIWHNYFVKNSSKLADYISYRYESKRISYDLSNASNYDYKIFTPKKDTILFRLISGSKLVMPIVCINTNKNLIYFLKDYSAENSNWDNRGIKLDFPVFIN